MIEKLKPSQRKALIQAKHDGDGGWYVLRSHPGYRGLPKLGLVSEPSTPTGCRVASAG